MRICWNIIIAIMVFLPVSLKGAEVELEKLTELDLLTAQAIALSDNPGLAATRARVVQARERLEQARSLYYPSIDLAASMGQTRLSDNSFDMQQPGSSGERTREYSGVSLSASWIAFDGFARKLTNLMAEQGAEGSFQAKRDGQRLLLQSVADAYYAAQLANYDVAISRADQGFNQRQLDDARVSYDQGAVSLSTVLNFEIQVNKARTQILQAERAYQIRLYGLAVLMGRKDAELPSGLQLTSLVMIEEEQYSQPLMEDMIVLAFSERPDVKMLELMVERSRAYVDKTKSENYPKVAVRGSVDGESDNYELEEDEFGTSLGLTLSYNLFRGWGDQANTAEAVSASREAVYNMQQLRNQVSFEVREAVADLQLAQSQLVLQRETTELVRRTRDLVEVGYNAGQESLVRLNETQRDLVRSQSNLALALVGLYNIRYGLDTVTGVSLQGFED
jgi:outer membrane protein TolC